MTPPAINASSREERMDYIIHEFRGLADYDNCGHCQFLHGRNALDVYRDYVDGKREFMEVTLEWRRV